MNETNSIDPEFYNIVVAIPRKKPPFKVWVEFPKADGSLVEPFIDATGMHHIGFQMPTGDDHHVALGKFVDQWRKLELCVQQLLSDLLESPGMILVHPLTNSLGNKGLYDVLSALVYRFALPETQSSAQRLLDSFKSLNAKRNYILHGQWSVEALVKTSGREVSVRTTLYRMYHPSDPATFTKLKYEVNQKERSRYLFSIDKIYQIIEDIKKLKIDFTKFRLNPDFKNRRNFVDQVVK